MIAGAPYVQYGADLGGRKLGRPARREVVSAIDVPPRCRVFDAGAPLYDVEGNLKQPAMRRSAWPTAEGIVSRTGTLGVMVKAGRSSTVAASATRRSRSAVP